MPSRLRTVAARLLVAVAVLCPAAGSHAGDESRARELARDAYHQIEGNSFRIAELQAALAKVDEAQEIDPEEPYVYLARALLASVSGYVSGDRYDLGRYRAGHIARAAELSEVAVRLDPKLSISNATLARFYIVQQRYDEAFALLDRASDLDNSSFYPDFFLAVLYERLGKIDEARGHLAVAQRHGTHDYQSVLVKYHQMGLARLSGDVEQEEILFRELIEMEPQAAHHYGNYANFLRRNGRYDEAIDYFNKAIEIRPYGVAIRQLEVTRQQKAARDQAN